jgi:hypothetical protein
MIKMTITIKYLLPLLILYLGLVVVWAGLEHFHHLDFHQIHPGCRLDCRLSYWGYLQENQMNRRNQV